MHVEGGILDMSYHVPCDNPEIGLAERVDIEMVAEIVRGEPDTTRKIFFVGFIEFSVVRQSTQYPAATRGQNMDTARGPAVVNRIAFHQ